MCVGKNVGILNRSLKNRIKLNVHIYHDSATPLPFQTYKEAQNRFFCGMITAGLFEEESWK